MIKRLTCAALASLIVLALAVGGVPKARAYTSYWTKIWSVQPANLLAHWPLAEQTGAVARDFSGNSRDSAYSGATLNAALGPDNGGVPSFDGINDYVNLYSSSLAATFNGNQGSLSLWFKVPASTWTDGQPHRLLHIRADGQNRILIHQGIPSNTVTVQRYGSATTKTVTISTSTTAWVNLSATWSTATDEFKVYWNGVQTGSTQTAIGSWVGALNNTTTIAAINDTALANPFLGNLAHIALWNVVLTDAEIAYISDTTIPPTATPTATYTPSVTPSPTPNIYSYISLTSGQVGRVGFEINVGQILIALIGLIICGMVIWMAWHSMTTARG